LVKTNKFKVLKVNNYNILIDFIGKPLVAIMANIIAYSEPFLTTLKNYRGVLRLFPATPRLVVREDVVLDPWVYTRHKTAEKAG